MFIAFLLLGLSIGHIAGLTDAPVTAILIPSFVGLIGGSAAAFAKDYTAAKLRTLSYCIAGISLGVVVGLHTGIYIKFHAYTEQRNTVASLNSILRSDRVGRVEEIEMLLRNRQISSEDAVRDLLELIRGRR
jgi:hypothetical protein